MGIYLLHNDGIQTVPDGVFYPDICGIVYRFIHFYIWQIISSKYSILTSN